MVDGGKVQVHGEFYLLAKRGPYYNKDVKKREVSKREETKDKNIGGFTMKNYTLDIYGLRKDRLVDTMMKAKGRVVVMNGAEDTMLIVDENKDQAYVEQIVNDNYKKDIKLIITDKDIFRFWAVMVRQAA